MVSVNAFPACKEGEIHVSLPLAVTLYTSQDCVAEEFTRVTEKLGCVVLFQTRVSPFEGSSMVPDFG